MPSAARMLLYLITDRSALGPDPQALDRLVSMVGDASSAGIDYVQIRERDLPLPVLLDLARRAKRAAGDGVRVLVNDRADVAIAAGLDGVHLTTRSVPARAVRDACGTSFVIGASTHSPAEVRDAEAGGADLVVCGPVFDTPSKRGMGDPLGADRVAAIAEAARIPVLGLGGITRTNARIAGAHLAGIAAIRAFQEAWLDRGRDGLASLAAELRGAI